MSKSVIEKAYEEKLEAKKIYTETVDRIAKSLEDYVFLQMSCDEDMKGEKVKLIGRISILTPNLAESHRSEDSRTELQAYFTMEYQNPETTCSQIMLMDNTKISLSIKPKSIKNEEFINFLSSSHNQPKEYHLNEFKNIEEIFKSFPYLCSIKDNPITKWNYVCESNILSGLSAPNRSPKKVMLHDSLLKIISQEIVDNLKEQSDPHINAIEKKIMAMQLENNLKHKKDINPSSKKVKI